MKISVFNSKYFGIILGISYFFSLSFTNHAAGIDSLSKKATRDAGKNLGEGFTEGVGNVLGNISGENAEKIAYTLSSAGFKGFANGMEGDALGASLRSPINSRAWGSRSPAPRS